MGSGWGRGYGVHPPFGGDRVVGGRAGSGIYSYSRYERNGTRGGKNQHEIDSNDTADSSRMARPIYYYVLRCPASGTAGAKGLSARPEGAGDREIRGG